MDETPEAIAARIANGHAFNVHVAKHQEFQNPHRGPVLQIATREDYRQHIEEVLRSDETQCCTIYTTEQIWRQADLFFYHPRQIRLSLSR